MTSKKQQYYIRRCHELSLIAGKDTNPNPNVGALLVENDEIIGEGWHERHGSAHAEINALDNVKRSAKGRIKDSTMYVSLEPCAIHGNTPPCTDAILRENISDVVISARDKTTGVDQVSEYILKNKDVNLTYGIDQYVGDYIARPRNIFVTKNRPYIILKWAESSDGYMGLKDQRTPVSNAYSRRYVHQIRSKVDAILVGRRTVEIDNPSLTNRYYSGEHPTRVILGSIHPEDKPRYSVFSDDAPTIVLDSSSVSLGKGQGYLEASCAYLHTQGMMTMLVEGGRQTLEGFIQEGLWDECHIITNENALKDGIKAPKAPDQAPVQSFNIFNDHIRIFHNH